MRKATPVSLVCTLAVSLLVWTPPVHAYIDPGTASMLFQMLIAGVMGAMVTAGVFWTRVKAAAASFFQMFRKKTGDES